MELESEKSPAQDRKLSNRGNINNSLLLRGQNMSLGKPIDYICRLIN